MTNAAKKVIVKTAVMNGEALKFIYVSVFSDSLIGLMLLLKTIMDRKCCSNMEESEFLRTCF
ncbi:MAG: hypothetical protein CME63_14455 [Halobacteriovoraceae bacterium]|nr:hypothetical protein [Halobacteriovoraceae bacterium]MBC98942.1 hypothetical protein [Halobacteriovoraceae bacterium]